MTFGIRLKQIRIGNGLTSAQMQQRLHVSQSTYSRLENNKTTPNEDILKRIAAEFNVDPQWLNSNEESIYMNKNVFNDANMYSSTVGSFHWAIIEILQQQLHIMKCILEKLGKSV